MAVSVSMLLNKLTLQKQKNLNNGDAIYFGLVQSWK